MNSRDDNVLMLNGLFERGNTKLDPEMVQWCTDTLAPGWEFGWIKRGGGKITIAGKDGAEDEIIDYRYSFFCVRFATLYDMIAFRLRWTAESSLIE